MLQWKTLYLCGVAGHSPPPAFRKFHWYNISFNYVFFYYNMFDKKLCESEHMDISSNPVEVLLQNCAKIFQSKCMLEIFPYYADWKKIRTKFVCFLGETMDSSFSAVQFSS